MRDLAKKYGGRDTRTVRRAIAPYTEIRPQGRERGRKLGQKSEEVPPFPVKEAVKFYEQQGLELHDLAKIYDCHWMTIRRYIAPYTTIRKPGRQPIPFDVEEAWRLRQAGATLRAIADKYGVVAQTVLNHLNKYEAQREAAERSEEGDAQ